MVDAPFFSPTFSLNSFREGIYLHAGFDMFTLQSSNAIEQNSSY